MSKRDDAFAVQPIETAPKDGSVILVTETYKWVPYKPGAPKHLQGKGRWMVLTEYGWERAKNTPSHWLQALAQGEQS